MSRQSFLLGDLKVNELLEREKNRTETLQNWNVLKRFDEIYEDVVNMKLINKIKNH